MQNSLLANCTTFVTAIARDPIVRMNARISDDPRSPVLKKELRIPPGSHRTDNPRSFWMSVLSQVRLSAEAIDSNWYHCQILFSSIKPTTTIRGLSVMEAVFRMICSTMTSSKEEMKLNVCGSKDMAIRVPKPLRFVMVE